MFWNFGDFMAFSQETDFGFTSPGWFGYVTCPHVSLGEYHRQTRKEKYSLDCACLFFSGFLAFSSPLTILHPKVQWFVDSDVWNLLFLVLLGPFLLAGMIMLFYAIRRARSEEEKSQLRYFLIATLIGVPTGLTDLIQIFNIPVPPLGHIGCLAYSSILAIGVFKHRRAYDILVQMKVKLEEEALRKSEEKYRTILHSIEEGYYEVDLAGNLTFFTDRLCTFGYSKEEMMGMNNRQFMTEESAKKVYQVFGEVYRTGEPANAFDWEMVKKDGTTRWIETSVSLIRDSKGQPIGFRGIGRDVTERKQMEEQAKVHQQQLMQAGKMVALGTLVSSVGHEINNPTILSCSAPILKSGNMFCPFSMNTVRRTEISQLAA
jgi:PAS domain S-box-containing protein